MKKLLFIIGTRPEAIKLSPIILNLRSEQWAEVKVISNGQQDLIVEDILSSFNIKIDCKFNLKSKNIYKKISKKNNLFGDDNASKLIIEKLKNYLIK